MLPREATGTDAQAAHQEAARLVAAWDRWQNEGGPSAGLDVWEWAGEALATLRNCAELSVRAVQHRAWRNKVAKGFNITDVPMEFGLTLEELGEAFSAWRKGRADLGGELADVMIFLAGLAEITGVDLQAEVERKLVLNESREYKFLPNGTPVKT
jgi:hypothetical protein